MGTKNQGAVLQGFCWHALQGGVPDKTPPGCPGPAGGGVNLGPTEGAAGKETRIDPGLRKAPSRSQLSDEMSLDFFLLVDTAPSLLTVSRACQVPPDQPLLSVPSRGVQNWVASHPSFVLTVYSYAFAFNS